MFIKFFKSCDDLFGHVGIRRNNSLNSKFSFFFKVSKEYKTTSSVVDLSP